jgi:hypothetical protein
VIECNFALILGLSLWESKSVASVSKVESRLVVKLVKVAFSQIMISKLASSFD